jgi:hypothetical protein
VNQTLSAMKKDNQISVDANHRITVHDSKGLEAYL